MLNEEGELFKTVQSSAAELPSCPPYLLSAAGERAPRPPQVALAAGQDQSCLSSPPQPTASAFHDMRLVTHLMVTHHCLQRCARAGADMDYHRLIQHFSVAAEGGLPSYLCPTPRTARERMLVRMASARTPPIHCIKRAIACVLRTSPTDVSRACVRSLAGQFRAPQPYRTYHSRTCKRFGIKRRRCAQKRRLRLQPPLRSPVHTCPASVSRADRVCVRPSQVSAPTLGGRGWRDRIKPKPPGERVARRSSPATGSRPRPWRARAKRSRLRGEPLWAGCGTAGRSRCRACRWPRRFMCSVCNLHRAGSASAGTGKMHVDAMYAVRAQPMWRHSKPRLAG